ncbi:hypothetical protein KR018_003392, partial [Drosophila ironensis]
LQPNSIFTFADRSEVEPKQLAYNPTYEIWFFIPSGRPDSVPKNVQDAYFASQNSGGVCYLNEWYYCRSGQVIKV